jgi:hypothetical protein
VGKSWRISRLNREKGTRAHFGCCCQLSLGNIARAELDRTTSAAAMGQPGQCVERGLRAAKVIYQVAKGRGPDLFTPD